MSSTTPLSRTPSASRESVPGDDASERSVLEWAIRRFRADRIAVASAFGPGTTVLLHLLSEIGARLPVIFIDTLYHFPETLRHVERVSRLYDLDLRVVRPAVDRATLVDRLPRAADVSTRVDGGRARAAGYREAARAGAHAAGHR